jgi:hypothetical protein
MKTVAGLSSSRTWRRQPAARSGRCRGDYCELFEGSPSQSADMRAHNVTPLIDHPVSGEHEGYGMLCRPWSHVRTGRHKLDDLRISEMPLAKQPAAGINSCVAYSASRRLRLQHTRERQAILQAGKRRYRSIEDFDDATGDGVDQYGMPIYNSVAVLRCFKLGGYFVIGDISIGQ